MGFFLLFLFLLSKKIKIPSIYLPYFFIHYHWNFYERRIILSFIPLFFSIFSPLWPCNYYIPEISKESFLREILRKRILQGSIVLRYTKGPSINDVTHLGGGKICQKLMLLQKPFLVKMVTRGQKSQKMDDIIYGRPLTWSCFLWRVLMSHFYVQDRSVDISITYYVVKWVSTIRKLEYKTWSNLQYIVEHHNLAYHSME